MMKALVVAGVSALTMALSLGMASSAFAATGSTSVQRPAPALRFYPGGSPDGPIVRHPVHPIPVLPKPPIVYRPDPIHPTPTARPIRHYPLNPVDPVWFPGHWQLPTQITKGHPVDPVWVPGHWQFPLQAK